MNEANSSKGKGRILLLIRGESAEPDPVRRHCPARNVFAPLLLLLCQNPVGAISCPPEPGDRVYETNQVNQAGTPMDKLLERSTDEAGNTWQVWCVDDACFGVRYVPKTGTSVWVGKCWFPGGRNVWDKCGPDDAGRRGIKDVYTKLSWKNVPLPGGGEKDWYFSFDPATGVLKVDKTTGIWSAPYQVGTNWVRRWITTGSSQHYQGPAPQAYEDIPGSATPGVDPPGWAASLFQMDVVKYGPNWVYGIGLPTLGGSGNEFDPYLGLPVEILTGDTLTVAATGLLDPYVTGDAAALGWALSEWGDGYAEYVYQGDPTWLDPGYSVDGFGFHSDSAAGLLAWNADGQGLNCDWENTPETVSSGAWLGCSLLVIAALVNRRRFPAFKTFARWNVL